MVRTSVFFFSSRRRHTRSLCDWSSDVCSSDLFRPWVYTDGLHAYLEELYVVPARRGHGLGRALLETAIETARDEGATHMELGTGEDDAVRSEERRVGKECRSRRWQHHCKRQSD